MYLRNWEWLIVLMDCMYNESQEHYSHAYYFALKIWKYDLEKLYFILVTVHSI